MLTVILTILKVIGIIIGIILGILLLLVAEILWVPFRYKMIAKKEEDFSVQVKLHWLLRFIFVDLTYENSKLVFLIRVLGYRVYDSRRPKKEKKRKKNKKVKKKSRAKESKKKTSEPKALPNNTEESKDTKQTVVEKSKDAKQTIVEEDEDAKSNQPSKQKPVSMKNKIRRILTSIKSFPGKLKTMFAHLKEKIKKIKGILRNIVSFPSKIKTLIFDETTTSAFTLIWKIVRDLLHATGPRRVCGYVEFGLEDPCSTGEVVGLVSVVLAYLNIKPKKVRIIPDFTQAKLKGEIKAVGRVYSFTVLRLFLKLYRDENIKQLKQRINQFKEG